MQKKELDKADYEKLSEHALREVILFIVQIRNDPERIKKLREVINEFPFVTYKEIAATMDVRVGTVRKWVSDGSLARVNMGSHALVPKAELQRFVGERYISREEQQEQKKRKQLKDKD
jgi:excisionase family DNA binding protein